jgi:NADH-quinone oxidoreductase subunit H
MFAIASIAVFGVSLAGWSSNNKYALLGGIRASAQMISYEVTLGLTLVGLMIVFESLRLDVMTDVQKGHLWGVIPEWGVLFQPLAILAYFAAASAEIKRGPFDLPEGESEIVGYFIEYSGLKFGLFMIAEFVEVVVFAGVFTCLFFGGYHLPWGEDWLFRKVNEWHHPGLLGLIQFITFITKVVFFCWLSLTVRWTFPRFRYDQVMNLGWKILLPLSLANVIITGCVMLAWGREGAAIFGLLQFALIIAFAVGGFRVKRAGGETLLPAEGEAHADHGHGHDAHAAPAAGH